MIKIRPINESCDCPFYTLDHLDRNICFVRHLTNPEVVTHLIDGPISDLTNLSK